MNRPTEALPARLRALAAEIEQHASIDVSGGRQLGDIVGGLSLVEPGFAVVVSIRKDQFEGRMEVACTITDHRNRSYSAPTLQGAFALWMAEKDVTHHVLEAEAVLTAHCLPEAAF